MVILHIAAISNGSLAGVDVAVPQHVNAQSKNEKVALINITNARIDGIEQQFEYGAAFDISKLPEPFCKPDLVVFHNTYYVEFLKIAGHLTRKKIPYIIVPHGTLSFVAQSKKKLKKTVANFLFFNKFFRNAQAIQFLSENEMKNSKFNEKGFIGTNGVDVPEVRAARGNKNDIRMVYIGRPEVYIKGIDMMIEAVGKSREMFADKHARLDLYGPNNNGEYKVVESLISKFDVNDLITLNEAVVGKEKREILLGADIFIQTSRSEGMPMSIIEALSYGIPCIVTEGTSLGGVIEKNNAGWVAQTNTDSIAETIKKALSEKNLWTEKSKNAIKLIEENYAWDKVAYETILKYKEIVRKI